VFLLSQNLRNPFLPLSLLSTNPLPPHQPLNLPPLLLLLPPPLLLLNLLLLPLLTLRLLGLGLLSLLPIKRSGVPLSLKNREEPQRHLPVLCLVVVLKLLLLLLPLLVDLLTVLNTLPCKPLIPSIPRNASSRYAVIHLNASQVFTEFIYLSGCRGSDFYDSAQWPFDCEIRPH
jgi:hypothetical protein